MHGRLRFRLLVPGNASVNACVGLHWRILDCDWHGRCQAGALQYDVNRALFVTPDHICILPKLTTGVCRRPGVTFVTHVEYSTRACNNLLLLRKVKSNRMLVFLLFTFVLFAFHFMLSYQIIVIHSFNIYAKTLLQLLWNTKYKSPF